MKFFIPFRFRQRDSNMYNILRSDHPITSLEFLTAEYGHWPPNGVSFATTERLDQKVIFRSFKQDPDQPPLLMKPLFKLGVLGYVKGKQASPLASKEDDDSDDVRAIHINNFLFSGPGHVGYQYLAYGVWKGFLKTVSSLVPVSLAAIKANIGFLGMMWSSKRYSYLNALFSPFNYRYFPSFRSIADVVGHEHIHVLQLKDKDFSTSESIVQAELDERPLLKTAYANISRLQKVKSVADKVFGMGFVEYLSNDLEVQARLHVTFINGYKRWGKLPETRHELWAALIDSGLLAPKSVKREVAEEAKRDPEIRRFMTKSTLFKLASIVVFDATAELNVASSHHSKLGLSEYFWRTSLPYLYGHMLELYGDPSGRSKMNFRRHQKPQALAQEYFEKNPQRPLANIAANLSKSFVGVRRSLGYGE